MRGGGRGEPGRESEASRPATCTERGSKRVELAEMNRGIRVDDTPCRLQLECLVEDLRYLYACW